MQLLLLPLRRGLNVRWRVAELNRPPLFRHVVEECEEAVEISLAKRIVFVVVAAAASQCEAEPDGGGRFNAVGNVLDGVFLRNDAAFGVPAVVAVESGGNPLVQRRLR